MKTSTYNPKQGTLPQTSWVQYDGTPQVWQKKWSHRVPGFCRASGVKISGQETFLFPIHSAVIVLLHSNWAQRWLLLSRSPTVLQRPSSLLLYVDIIPLYFIPSVIAMVVVIEVCQLHTVRNIAGECNLEAFDNQLTNWAARKIIMITGNTFLPVEFVCMHVSVSRQTCTLPPVNDVKVTVYHSYTPIYLWYTVTFLWVLQYS